MGFKSRFESGVEDTESNNVSEVKNQILETPEKKDNKNDSGEDSDSDDMESSNDRGMERESNPEKKSEISENKEKGSEKQEEQSIHNKFLDGYKSFISKLKGNESKEESDNNVEKKEDNANESDGKDKMSFADRLKVDISDDKQKEVSENYRKEHNLDEHGNRMDGNTERAAGGRTQGDDAYERRFGKFEEE